MAIIGNYKITRKNTREKKITYKLVLKQLKFAVSDDMYKSNIHVMKTDRLTILPMISNY